MQGLRQWEIKSRRLCPCSRAFLNSEDYLRLEETLDHHQQHLCGISWVDPNSAVVTSIQLWRHTPDSEPDKHIFCGGVGMWQIHHPWYLGSAPRVFRLAEAVLSTFVAAVVG